VVAVDPEVVVAGAGPVGLTLAIALGQRGVRCLVVDRASGPGTLPKMERCNARTMELFRRLGIADRVRSAGLGTDVPMDVFIMTRLVDEPILRLAYPSPDVHRERIAAVSDGSEPLEPYQLISQYVLEPLLGEIARELETVEVRFDCAVTALAQDADGVTVQLAGAGRPAEQVRAAFLVGCDGAVSTVRQSLGIQLRGRGGIGSLRQVQLRSDDLIDRVPIVGRGRHFCFADSDARMIGTTLVVQSDQRHFSFHTGLPEDAPFAETIARKIGTETDLEVISVAPWTLHLLLAERYRDRRVFLAGDAAHLVIPQGGLGMNTGVGDAVDLGWKLAAVLRGWGGEGLLRSYEAERRPVGERTLTASEYAAEGTAHWRRASSDAVLQDSAEGERVRAEVAAAADVHHRKSHEMKGIESGYRYDRSPIIDYGDETRPRDDGYAYAYVPSAAPGYRLPHVWCADGSALHDRFMDGFTVLVLGPDPGAGDGLLAALRRNGDPASLLHVPEESARAVYGADLLLIRPDLHVAWAGDHPPADPERIAARVAGRAETS
jgi:2-polyprenyl-6-methoxyphenol hydroxylase-like FAD-dependent oxidoreductase